MNLNYLIIVLNYNNWEDTVECVNSLHKNGINYSNILIVENCSSNDSYNKLQSASPSVKIIKTERNLGFAGGNNIGIKYALHNNFEYAILLNNDTLINSAETIPNLINEMDNKNETSLGSGRIFCYPQQEVIWYDGGKLIGWRATAIHYNYRLKKSEVRLKNNLQQIDFISGCFMCIRMRDFPKLGYLDEKFFMYLEDIEYCYRAKGNKLKLLYIPEAVIYHKAKGEEKNTPRLVYYSIRNRRLLIKLHLKIIAKVYFELVLFIKKFVWFFSNKHYYKILVQAISDYNKKYFGPAPKNIN
jgi:GT2 family glycosyltransferase